MCMGDGIYGEYYESNNVLGSRCYLVHVGIAMRNISATIQYTLAQANVSHKSYSLHKFIYILNTVQSLGVKLLCSVVI